MSERASPEVQGDTDVVTQIVTMTIKPEDERTFLELAAGVIEKVQANEPDTLLYVLTEHPNEPHTYVWVERYPNEQALAAHGEAPYIVEALQQLPGWWAKPPELLKLGQVLPASS